ncbi:EF-P 5-aminopentanol modification-associated protein YfmH [Vagococcus xieshaowenii]|uniref:Insulinase family protein n=1 Tax=Vagococcus xieshaowenii TaxID=2562451 RepID=A0AAJ5EDH4_9ENTE|nr:pitrilysin family protein [Vagococcus xieshaowenii]QCA28074.1 insulinase family protein [Vagococcus xieshaowenii]TFZ40117.1 insulinase family protein [Vagococcus xieshaowenii]
MEKKVYELINETLYTETLPNGLKVTLLPKEGFHKTYALFTTDYGSIDEEFKPIGQDEFVKVPDGIAHFLEHKMFEKEDGDVFQLFGKQGASANAFTSFTKTSYLFSSTDQVEKNLTTLLDFVQAPYFTEETVEKEKGIIGQEIQMYDDDPNWRTFFGLLQAMYPKHPLHIDIAGTIDSIAEITAEDLYLCYHTFYHPSNMNLFVVGKMDPEAIMTLIRDNQASKAFEAMPPIERKFPVETSEDIVKESTIYLDVTRPKAYVGIKGMEELPTNGYELLRKRTATSLLFQLLIGTTSDNYLTMYNEELVDDSFGFEFNMDRGFYFADFGGDTDQPEALVTRLKEILLTAQDSPELTEERLTLLKKRLMGNYLQSLNSLEYIANQFSKDSFGEATLFDMMNVINSITLKDIYDVVESFIKEDTMVTLYVYPKNKES